MKIIGWILFFFFALFLLWLSAIFGPIFHISYNNCVDEIEKPIIRNIRIYEKIPLKSSNILRQSDLSTKYDNPFLCIETYTGDDQCHINMTLGKYKLNKIEAKKIQLTGRIIKQYSFNTFNSDMYTLEVLLNNKKYLISHWGYDYMTIKNPIQRYKHRFKEPTCSIFNNVFK